MTSTLLITAGAALLHSLVAFLLWKTPEYEDPSVIAQNALDDEAMFRGAIWSVAGVAAIGVPASAQLFLLAFSVAVLLFALNACLRQLDIRRMRKRKPAPS